jgi:hypothetical protein
MPRKEIQDVKVQLNENISPELDIKIQSQMKHRAAGDPAPGMNATQRDPGCKSPVE